jgi:hypothetical protein
MKRSLWYTRLPDKHKKVLNAAVAALGPAAPAPEEGEDGSFVLPMRPGSVLSEAVLRQIAALARNVVLLPGCVQVFYEATTTVTDLEAASLLRRAQRAQGKMTVNPTARGMAGVAMRQVVELLDCADCSLPRARAGRVELQAEKLKAALWSEIATLLERVGALGDIRVTCSFPAGGLAFVVDMSGDTVV